MPICSFEDEKITKLKMLTWHNKVFFYFICKDTLMLKKSTKFNEFIIIIYVEFFKYIFRCLAHYYLNLIYFFRNFIKNYFITTFFKV
jgi:hypothetical protein